MKPIKNALLSLFVLIICFRCGEMNAPIEFQAPVKGRTINLSKKIGKSITIRNGNDTALINFSFLSDTNYITDIEGDTLFKGTATKRNDLYLLNRYITPNRVLIHAIKLEDSLITGLGTEWLQTNMYKTFMDSLNLNHIVIKSDTNHIETVGSQKKENKEIFRMIIQNLKSDTIITRKR